MASKSPKHDFWMRRAIQLSKKGFPAPNPHVGCVLVSNGECVGEGWHDFAGGPHAEAMALHEAGERAIGAEAYVTLEPCAHHGRQPPCADALISAGIRKVHVATDDPNPNVVGGGCERLRMAGVPAELGLLADEAEQVNRDWLFSMRHRRPLIALKAAMSLDGRIALPGGESKWITGDAARRRARRLRAEYGAVLVGSGTVAKDDPSLTSRTRGARNEPVRIVLDPERELDARAKVFDDRAATFRVVGTHRAQPDDIGLDLEAGRFDPMKLASALWNRGITAVLVEGGSLTLTSFLKAGLADRLEIFVGNAAFGAGPSWLEAQLGPTLEELPRWKLIHAKPIGNDVWMRFEPQDAGFRPG